MSLENLAQIKEGLTYDDVLLVPAYSEVLPRDVKLSSRFSKNIELKSVKHTKNSLFLSAIRNKKQ